MAWLRRFFFFKDEADSWTIDVPKMTPLSGPTYLGAYDSDGEQEEQELVRDFDSWNLISTDALRSAWPNGDWQVSLSHEEHMFGECKNIACPLPPLWQAAYIQAPILTCTILSKFLAAALTLASLDEPASQHAPKSIHRAALGPYSQAFRNNRLTELIWTQHHRRSPEKNRLCKPFPSESIHSRRIERSAATNARITAQIELGCYLPFGHVQACS